MPKGSTVGFGQVRDILKREFNRSVELQVHTPQQYTALHMVSMLTS